MRPILPKKPKRIDVAGTHRRASRVIFRVMTDAQRKLQTYPPQQPTRYERTGTLGRDWFFKPQTPQVEGGSLTMSVLNGLNKALYAVWVEGPTEGGGRRQTLIMRAKGWPSVTDVRKQLEPGLRRDLKDAVLESIS